MPRTLSEIIEDQQKQVLDIYLDTVSQRSQDERELLEKYLPSKPPKDPNLLVEEFFKLTEAEQLTIAAHLARIADIQGRVRNAVNSRFSTGFAEAVPIDAYSFRFTTHKLAETVSAEQLKDILSTTVISNSITAHPTNPYSTEFTVESMNLDRILSEENSPEKSAHLKDQIAKMISISPTPLVDAQNKGKKTQADEVIEAMSYMRNIYEELPKSARSMQKMIDDHKEYKDADVRIGKFYEMCAWLSGDGDGNPAATAASLQQNIDLFRQEIVQLYLRDLTELEKLAENDVLLKKSLDEIIGKLDPNYNSPDNSYKSPQELIADLRKLKSENPRITGKLEDLTYRVQNFGFHYAKIDVRHDAADISVSAVEILYALDKFDKSQRDNFLKRLKDKDEEVVKKCTEELTKYLDFEQIDKTPEQIFQALKDKGSAEIAMRIFGRLQVVAANPECSDKLIIAECKGADNALAAMFLLKASGNSINQKGSMNIVTLSESADDLIALPDNIKALLANKTYRDHVIKNGTLSYMIAKSDTQRRDGVGAQYAQELAVEKVTEMFAELAWQYPELQNVRLIPFNGGGHALQRGGGRIDELSNVYEKAALRGLNNWAEKKTVSDKPNESTAEFAKRKAKFVLKMSANIMPPTLTTQGHQNGILFNSSNAGNFLNSYLSQSIYAEAKMRGLIEEVEATRDRVPNKLARENRELFFERARKFYRDEIVEKDSPINVLFRKGPWAGIELTNVSSRPSKRVESKDAPQLIDQRAIGAERMCAHSGTHLISWYSARAGLQAVLDNKGIEEAGSMYSSDKSTRDTFRSMAMSLFMTDFNISWNMMIGEKRPGTEQIKELAAKYKTGDFEQLPEKERDKITLAHIENEAIETAKIIYKIVVASGRIPEKAPKELSDNEQAPKELLNILWQNLAVEIDHREEKLKFAHLAEAKVMADLPADEKRYPKSPIKEALIRFLNTACVGSEAPTIPMISSTKRIGDIHLQIPETLAKQLAVVGELSPALGVNGTDSKKLAPNESERSKL